MRLAVMALIGAAILSGPAVGRGQGAQDVFDAWEGRCGAESHTADATGRTPYPCNAMFHVAMAAEPGHEQLIFVIKGDPGKQNGVLLSVGGMIDSQGNLEVQRVQFTPAKSTPIGPGGKCTIARQSGALKRIQCSATASDGSGRSMALDFVVTGKMALPK